MTVLLVSFEQISCVYFVHDIVQRRVIAVGDDSGGAAFEFGEVVHDLRAEEGGAVREGGFVDDHRGAFGLDALHDTLDGGLAEVVGVGLHREAVDSDHDFLLLRGGVGVDAGVAVVADAVEDPVRDEVLAGAVAVHDGLDEVLRDVVEVRQELLGVLRQAVAAVAEGGVVVVVADAGVEADALDDGLGVEALHLGVGVQLVEVAHAQRQVGVGEELDGFGLSAAHEQHLRVVQGCFLQQPGELFRASGRLVTAYDDAGRIEVVVERFALAEELRREEDVGHDGAEGAVGLALAVAELLADRAGVADRDGALDHHHGVGVDLQHQLDDLLHVGGVEEVLLGIVVGGRGDDDEVGVAVGGAPVEGRDEVQFFFREVFLNVFVLNGRDAAVDLLDLLGDHVHGDDLVLLREERGDGEADVAGTGDCYFHTVGLRCPIRSGMTAWGPRMTVKFSLKNQGGCS